jgi:hypothetical protein
MKRIAMAGNWSRKANKIALQPALRRYRPYLEDRILAASTNESYLNKVKLFLDRGETDTPSTSQFDSHQEILRNKNNRIS